MSGRKLVAILLISVGTIPGCCRNPPPEGLVIAVHSPAPDAVVGHRILVEGEVSDPSTRVWVLVHPLAGGQWWVQRRPAPASQDGSWNSYAFFGTKELGEGELFELMVIATCKKLREGQEMDLDDLPSGTIRSEAVTVIRQ